jgi:hypothetical protein
MGADFISGENEPPVLERGSSVSVSRFPLSEKSALIGVNLRTMP